MVPRPSRHHGWSATAVPVSPAATSAGYPGQPPTATVLPGLSPRDELTAGRLERRLVGRQISRGGQQGAGQPAEGDRGQFLGGEPGDLAEFTVGGSGGAVDDDGLVDRADVGDPVAVRVGDLVIRPA